MPGHTTAIIAVKFSQCREVQPSDFADGHSMVKWILLLFFSGSCWETFSPVAALASASSMKLASVTSD